MGTFMSESEHCSCGGPFDPDCPRAVLRSRHASWCDEYTYDCEHALLAIRAALDGRQSAEHAVAAIYRILGRK